MALSQVERLDLVARSKVSTSVVLYARVVLLILSPLFIVLAANSAAPPRETVLVAVIAVGSLLTAVVLWLNWRFKVYFLSLWCFLFATGNVISSDHPRSHSVLGWIAAHAWGLFFAYYGCALWLVARRYALANESSFGKEREQLEKWMDEHSAIPGIEFPSGSFWTGYWTQRILNPGDCWIVAQFKRGGNTLTSCRVYELRDVSFTRLPSGKWQIDIAPKSGKKKSFVEIDVSVPFSSHPTLAV